MSVNRLLLLALGCGPFGFRRTMKSNGVSLLRLSAGFALLLPAVGSRAAPVTWFPGPSLYDPISRTAPVTAAGHGNVLVGGTDYYDGGSYPVYLIATNGYWSGFGAGF